MRVALAFAALVALVALPARADELAPRVEHQPLTTVKKGEVVELRARVTATAGHAVLEALVYVRVEGIVGFTRVAMKAFPEVPGIFVAHVPAALVGAGFAYYLEAYDADGNGPGRAGSPDAPFQVTAVSSDLPVAPPVTAQPRVVAPEPAPQPLVVMAAAPRPRRARSQLPTFGLFTVAGLGLCAGVGGQVGYQVTKSDAGRAFAGQSRDFTASQYRFGETAGTISIVGFVAAGLALAGAITWLAWPDSEPAAEPEKKFAPEAPKPAAPAASPEKPSAAPKPDEEFDR